MTRILKEVEHGEATEIDRWWNWHSHPEWGPAITFSVGGPTAEAAMDYLRKAVFAFVGDRRFACRMGFQVREDGVYETGPNIIGDIPPEMLGKPKFCAVTRIFVEGAYPNYPERWRDEPPVSATPEGLEFIRRQCEPPKVVTG